MIIKQEVLLSLLVILIASSTCDKLTDIENYERVNNCGKQELPMFDGNKEQINFPTETWLVKVAFIKENEIGAYFALGSFISPRHVLTSSQPIMDDRKRWNWNDEDVPNGDYIGDTTDVLVPMDRMGDTKLLVTRNVSDAVRISELPAVKSAWILDAKNQDDLGQMRSPMIIELERNVPDMKYACLTNGSTPEDVGDTVHIYGFTGSTRDTLDYRNEKIIELTASGRSISLNRYVALKDRGGPLLKVINGTSIILGIGGSPADEVDKFKTYFFKMSHLVNKTCTYAGICNIPANFTPPTATTAFVPITLPSTTAPDQSTTMSNQTNTTAAGAPSLKTGAPPTKKEADDYYYGDEEVSVEWGEDVFQANGRNGCNWILIALLVLLKWGIGH